MRSESIKQAQEAKTVGIILGTLGRQGSLDILEVLNRRWELTPTAYSIKSGEERNSIHHCFSIRDFP
jgi:diphthamide biosynthesis enzyme Dph1/Dph2-like protein